MKNRNFIAVIFFLLILSGCSKEDFQNAIVVRDCTGTYLRVTDKDYRVCNLDKVASFPDGAEVTAKFKTIDGDDCDALHDFWCAMFHASEGMIKIEKIK